MDFDVDSFCLHIYAVFACQFLPPFRCGSKRVGWGDQATLPLQDQWIPLSPPSIFRKKRMKKKVIVRRREREEQDEKGDEALLDVLVRFVTTSVPFGSVL